MAAVATPPLPNEKAAPRGRYIYLETTITIVSFFLWKENLPCQTDPSIFCLNSLNERSRWDDSKNGILCPLRQIDILKVHNFKTIYHRGKLRPASESPHQDFSFKLHRLKIEDICFFLQSQ